MAPALSDGERMVTAARAASRAAIVGQNYIQSPAVPFIAKFLKSGAIGSPRTDAHSKVAPSRSIVGRNSGKLVATIATSSIVIGSRLASPMMRKLIAIR
jgi:hypothetical protein